MNEFVDILRYGTSSVPDLTALFACLSSKTYLFQGQGSFAGQNFSIRKEQCVILPENIKSRYKKYRLKYFSKTRVAPLNLLYALLLNVFLFNNRNKCVQNNL